MMVSLLSNQVCLPRIPFIRAQRTPPPLLDRPATEPSYRSMGFFLSSSRRKEKVVVVMGASGTGKSRLAIDIALHFGGEVVNSDKMQVYDGLAVVTNKVTCEECAGVPHHLLGGIPPDADYTASDFRLAANLAVEGIVARGSLPVIAGGSNSFIEELIDGEGRDFRSRYECCFLWVDVLQQVLHGFVAERVDRMVERGLVEEVRGVFDPEADYSKGLRKAIGVPEMDRYLRAEAEGKIADEETKARLLKAAIDEIKANTCKLTCCQLQKIHRLSMMPGWVMHRIDATDVFRKRGEEADRAWEARVCGPSVEIVRQFLQKEAAEKEEEDQVVEYNKKKKKDLSNETAFAAAGVTAAVMKGGSGASAAAIAAAVAVVEPARAEVRNKRGAGARVAGEWAAGPAGGGRGRVEVGGRRRVPHEAKHKACARGGGVVAVPVKAVMHE